MNTTYCNRCAKPTNNMTTMSMFNTQIICFDCKMIEKKHPEYQSACEIESNEVKKGNRNYQGVGLPKDFNLFVEQLKKQKND